MAAVLNQRIAQRVSALRAARGLSLDALAAASGVSRSMISLIERGESSATAVVLDKLATALGTMLANLFDEPAPPASPVARLGEQGIWEDPASGYRRRNVTPGGAAQPVQIVDVNFPPGARVAFDTAHRESPVHQQVWVLDGAIDITLGSGEEAVRHRLKTGDCLAMRLDAPTMFHNPTRKPTRYAVVIAPAITSGVRR